MCLCLAAFQVVIVAQTDKEIFVIDLRINGQTVTTFFKGECGFNTADWGGGLASDLCLPIVWAYDITPDSLCCDMVMNDYSGKMVMIRRGNCEFKSKAINAANAGAQAVAIANSFASGTNCTAPSPNSIGSTSLQIPIVMFSRNMANQFDDAIKAGLEPEICFRLLNVYAPSAEYSYAIPANQGVPVELIKVRAVNRSTGAQNFTAKCLITDPAGLTTELASEPKLIASEQEADLEFPGYQPPAGLVGEYSLRFTVNNLTDTVYRSFILTPYTWATDNFLRNGGASNDASFAAGGNIYQTASFVVTGTGGTVQYATFGIENAAEIADLNQPENNVVSVLLYDADANLDGVNDLGSGQTLFNNLEIIAFADVNFTQNTTNDLIDVELTPIGGVNNTLLPNHLYYISIKYDGSNNTTAPGKSISFSTSQKVNYHNPEELLHTPLVMDNSNEGWVSGTVITRLHELGYVPPLKTQTVVLNPNKYRISPNPASNRVNLDLQLEKTNRVVTLQLLDVWGKTLQTQRQSNIQNNPFSFDCSAAPSGQYYLHLWTSDEGSAMIPVIIGH